MAKPSVYRRADIQHRKDSLPEGGTYIKPMVTAKNSESTMAGGINFLNKVSVPFDIPCDELIVGYEGNLRLTCDGESYEIGPGDMMFVPKDNHIAYEADGECTIFYAAYPVNWKQLAGLTAVPGIDPEAM